MKHIILLTFIFQVINQGYITEKMDSIYSYNSSDNPLNKYEWESHDDYLALVNDGQMVWQYNFCKDEGKPYVHPLALTDGTVLTSLHPADHPHHRALWFSWKDIDGLNYWRERPETGRAEGITEIQNVDVKRDADFSAEITMDLEYFPYGGETILTEQRTVYFSRPDDNGNYYLDWVSEFTAGEDEIILERTPLAHEEGGRPHGGYGGFSLRLAQDLENIQFFGSETGLSDEESDNDEMTENLHGNYARWVKIQGVSTTGNKAAIIMMGHPQNLNAPEPWWINEDDSIPFYYINPAPLFYQNLVINPDEVFHLSYRVLIINHEVSEDDIWDSYHSFIDKYRR